MGVTPRNSIKGYSYQQSIFILFLSIMDTERKISKITVEATDTKHFDDIYLENVLCDDNSTKSYRIQVKNYPGTKLTDILITDNCVKIKTNKNDYESSDNNILVVNSTQIETNSVFMGLPCVYKKNVIIIPMTPEQCAKKIDAMFNSDVRTLQIIHKANEITQNAKFEITIEELPDVIQMSVDLENETILLRKVPERLPYEITLIEGKPGIGKSHFVNELCEYYPDAIVYRFWIGSQDPDVNNRIQFGNFINELGIKVYGSSKRVYIDELIETIRKEDKILIIDGLDHVENYNPSQIDLFVDFIDKLQGIRVIVLSRPVKKELKWNKEILLDWTIEETRIYLEMTYQIHDYIIQTQIYKVSKGYPIITYYVAEDYKLSGEIQTGENTINNLNDYYDTLFINHENPSAVMGIFATGNCFFTWKELKSFFSEPELFEVIQEFINLHPYLFKIIANRVSLIHESFNAYLREKISSFSKRKEKILEIVQKSLLSGSVEYIDRMQSFSLEDDFYEKMLKKYSDFEEFKCLAASTCDYDSIASLYLQLQKQLESLKGVLDIYQLYSFLLLFEISQRNDLIGSEKLVFQILKYMNTHGGIEDAIYSSEYMWHVYLVCMKQENMTKRYLINKKISESQYYSLVEVINSECTFYEKKDKSIKFSNIEKELQNPKKIRVSTILTNYFISVWIHGNPRDKFYNEFVEYMNGNENSIDKIVQELAPFKIDHFWIKHGLSLAEYQLHELGYFGEENKFKNCSLEDIIRKGAVKGSYEAVSLAASYLKLANYEKRDVDIESLAYAWTVYYQRKDYSVYTIEKALIVFEEEKLIEEDESFEIISKVMEQSEKGISHLLTNYVNQKGVSYIQKLIAKRYFSDKNNSIKFWELNSMLLNCFDKEDMVEQLTELLKTRLYSKYIEYKDISNSLQSKYKDMILDEIKYYGITMLYPIEDLCSELDFRGIKYIIDKDKIEDKYIPLNHGCIYEEDFNYIKEQGVKYIDVAKYTDGWYSCLPYPDVFLIFDKFDIQKDYLNIIYEAIFAKCPKRTYIGEWHLLIGNIIEFLKEYEIEVDYSRFYNIFIKFLDISLIWHKV